MRDASVVIGLGGIGSEICAKVLRMMPEKAPDKEKIRFAAVDTDINSLLDLRRKGFSGTAIQISSDTSVGLCIENHQKEIESWFPNNPIFLKKPMTEGAGQMRVISRLALHAAVKEGKLAPLYRLIDELCQVSRSQSEQPLRFYIISSLAGGTGSGIFLPLAMYLENYVKGSCGDFHSICKGFFILPSALKEKADTFLERRSLDSNSYAAVKELNAFLNQEDGDSGLGKRLGLELAREGETGTTVYRGAGFEYCFLFGKVNTKKSTLSSPEEIERMVANSVYMQVCSPIHQINNSREDNTPKFLVDQMQALDSKKLRRFGGIGCGELVYPYEMLRSYYAMRWAIDVMSNQWQRYDKVYFEKVREQQERRKQGKRAEEVNRADEYINAISLADRSDFFAEDIRNSCKTEQGMRWDCYLREVSGEIRRQISRLRERRETDDHAGDGLMRRKLELIQGKNVKKSGKSILMNSVTTLFEEMHAEVERYLRENSRYVAKNLFTYHPEEEEQKPYEMEYWLNPSGEFLHPNAVRYFLYHLLNALAIRKDEIADQKAKEDIKLHCIDKYSGNQKKRRGTSGKNFKQFDADYKKAAEAMYEHACLELELLCIGPFIKYVERLIHSYEKFYEYYGEILQDFEDEKEMIEEELDRDKGAPRFYVCADAGCREAIFKRIQGERGYMQASASLSAFIFKTLQEPIKEREKQNRFQEFRQHWGDGVEQVFSAMLNINILHAIGLEEECVTGRAITGELLESAIKRFRGLLEAPFVQYETRQETKGISFCCFNSSLEEERGFYKGVVQWLTDTQGISDPFYCSPYQMIFYRSVVGIEAHEVLEFYHGRDKSLISDGEAFRHYEETVSHTLLDEEDKPVVVPHIDRKWYTFLEMPDSSRKYQQTMEIKTAAVFLYAVLSEKLVRSHGAYHYANENAGGRSFQKLLWSHQYLYQCPALLNALFDSLEEKLEEDAGTCRSFEDCHVFQYFKDDFGNQKLAEDSEIRYHNLFDVILDYGGELTEKEYDPGKGRILIAAVEWLIRFCILHFKEKEMEREVRKMMLEQKASKWMVTEEEGRVVLKLDELIDDYFIERGYEESKW